MRSLCLRTGRFVAERIAPVCFRALSALVIGLGAEEFEVGRDRRAPRAAQVSAESGQLYTPMACAPAMPFGSHEGRRMCGVLLTALEEHPASFTRFALRKRLAVVSGDGALVEGGADHRHSSTAAAEKVFATLWPEGGVPACTLWDPFHRSDIASFRAIRASPLAAKLFDVVKQLDYLFGQSEGVLLFRGVAHLTDETPRALRAPGGTRKIVYLSGAPGNFIANYKLIRSSLWARIAWARGGHGTQTVQHLLDLSRDVGDIGFVAFVLLLHDILERTLRPYAVVVQGALEPCVLARADARLRQRLHLTQRGIQRLRCGLRPAPAIRSQRHCRSD